MSLSHVSPLVIHVSLCYRLRTIAIITGYIYPKSELRPGLNEDVPNPYRDRRSPRSAASRETYVVAIGAEIRVIGKGGEISNVICFRLFPYKQFSNSIRCIVFIVLFKKHLRPKNGAGGKLRVRTIGDGPGNLPACLRGALMGTIRNPPVADFPYIHIKWRDIVAKNPPQQTLNKKLLRSKQTIHQKKNSKITIHTKRRNCKQIEQNNWNSVLGPFHLVGFPFWTVA